MARERSPVISATRGRHLAGRLVGERDGQDLVRADLAGRQQVGDPAGQHPGLARAGPGHDEQRGTLVRHGLPLLRVQALQEGVSGCAGGHPSSVGAPADSPPGIPAARPGLLVWDQGRRGPGQGLLLEERGPGDPHVDESGYPGQRGEEGDEEDPADLPVQAGHRPEGVAVGRRPVTLEGVDTRPPHDQPPSPGMMPRIQRLRALLVSVLR